MCEGVINCNCSDCVLYIDIISFVVNKDIIYNNN